MKQEIKIFKKREEAHWIRNLMHADLHVPNNRKKVLFLKHILYENHKVKQDKYDNRKVEQHKSPRRKGTGGKALRRRKVKTVPDTRKNTRVRTLRSLHDQTVPDATSLSGAHKFLKAQLTPFAMALKACNLTILDPEHMLIPRVFDEMATIAQVYLHGLAWTHLHAMTMCLHVIILSMHLIMLSIHVIILPIHVIMLSLHVIILSLHVVIKSLHVVTFSATVEHQGSQR